MRRSTLPFIRTFMITAASILLLSAAVIEGTSALGRPSLPYEKIYNFQIAKLEHARAEQLFIGDSSLGNSVNAQLWTKLSGEQTLNLALTGAFGYEGSYWMLQRALSAGIRPKIVYLMQTSDMLTRRPVDEELLAEISDARGSARLAAWWRSRMNLQELSSAFDFIREYFDESHRNQENFNIVNDYMEQHARVDLAKIPSALSQGEINAMKPAYLKKIASLCSSEGIRCIYIHGPLAEPTCKNSAQYFQAADKIIRDSGLLLLSPQPMCISIEQLGDAVDHVAPAEKDNFTSALFDLMQMKLGEGSKAPG